MRIRRIAITGHLSGIGKCLYDKFSPYYEVIGLDKDEGNGIEDTQRVVDKCLSFDVLINNAYLFNKQHALLYQFCKYSKDHPKLAISIGSIVTELEMFDYKLANENYYIEKMRLKKITQEVNGSGGKCKASLISQGFVDTNIDMFFEQPTVVEKTAMMWEICKEQNTILSPNAVFDAVKFIIDSYEKGNLVTHIVINN